MSGIIESGCVSVTDLCLPRMFPPPWHRIHTFQQDGCFTLTLLFIGLQKRPGKRRLLVFIPLSCTCVEFHAERQKSPGLFSSSIARLLSRDGFSGSLQGQSPGPRPPVCSPLGAVSQRLRQPHSSLARCWFLQASIISNDIFRPRAEQEMRWKRLERDKKLSLDETGPSFLGGNWCKPLPGAHCGHRTPLWSLQRRPQNNTGSGSHGEEKKEVTSHKSFVQPFLQRKPPRKTDPSASVSFLNRRFFCPFFFGERGTITHACGC